MGCYNPQHGYRSKALTANGKRKIVFNTREGYADRPITVPCGTCIGCRTAHAQQWASRCAHEAQLHEHNAFVTLTYDDAHLPHVNEDEDQPVTLRKQDFVTFMKRLRKHRADNYNRERKTKKDSPIPVTKFLQAAEYGSLGRPHHHAIIFGWWPTDATPWKKSGEHMLFRSPTLEQLWPHGYSSVGHVTAASAAYVAQYTLKKQHEEARFLGDIVPEYMTCSKGIGLLWLKLHHRDVYTKDYVVNREGYIHRPPRYYDEHYNKRFPEHFAEVKANRNREALLGNLKDQHLVAKAIIHMARLANRKERIK